MEYLKKLCQEWFDQSISGEYVDDDLENYIFEAAVELVLGAGVWERIKEESKKKEIERKKLEIKRLQKELGETD